MSENKNIERLFQEKFKDFEVIPQEIVWDNIEAELDKKEKRRVVPFWWKLSGIAAALLIGFLIANAFFFSNLTEKNNVVNQENKNPVKTNSTDKVVPNSIKENTAIVTSDIKSTDDKSEQSSLKSATNHSENNKGIAYSNEKDKPKNTATTSINQKKSTNNADLNQSTIASNDRIVSANLEKKGTVITKNNLVENPIEKAITNQENLVSKDIPNPKTTFENKSTESFHSNESILADKDIKNIDTTKIAVVTNALEELLKEKEVKKKAEPKLNRWQVATTVAPIYFSSTSGGGSPLDSRFESNDKEFQPSFSYGLGVNYSLNKKWSVRTGVNALALEYKTNNVVFFQTVNARQMEHVKSNLQGSMIEVDNKNNSGVPELNLNSEVIEKFNGSINQKIGYLEVPIEFSYKLMDKKFGIDMITGFSSLFLNENSVSVLSSGETINIGRANNLNTFHFSGNLGIGFRYRFWKAFNANVNPMLKYQMNTFNSDSGNFKPYAFGLYSGISYTF